MESIIVKEESIIENVEPQSTSFVDNYLAKLHKKCGEIFICDEDIFGFLCTVCESPFEEIDEFFTHVKSIHTSSLYNNELNKFQLSDGYDDNDGQFHVPEVCIDNNKDTENEKDPLENEINNTQTHKCTFCDLRFESKSTRYHHQISHKGKQNLENSKFDELSASDVSAKDDDAEDSIEKDSLESVEKKKKVKNPERDDLYKCTYCGLRFSSRSKRYQHQFKHKGEKPFACNICGRAFRLKFACENHEKKHGSVYKCDLCPASYTSLKSLTAHKRRHSDSQRAYKCNYCDKRFFARGEMISHERTHTGETPFLCIVCGLRFRRRGALLTHVACHSDVRPYKCSQCDKSFNLKDTLKHHIVVHTGERPFKCEICNASFPRKKALKSHEKIHLDKREYVCKICSKGFNQYSGLYSHMKSHGEVLTKISNYVNIVKN